MTTLHPEFYKKLLAVYSNVENAEHAPQLTQGELEKYETLVSKRHFLRLVQRGDLGRPAPAAAGKRGADKTLEKELQRIDQDLQTTLSDCMPDFHAVHDGWFSRHYAGELYKADYAYRRRLVPFAIGLGVFMVIGILSLLAMMP
jgi:hypothetical protein